jgi:hypothetical protein
MLSSSDVLLCGLVPATDPREAKPGVGSNRELDGTLNVVALIGADE